MAETTHHTPGPWRIRMDNASPPEPLRITCDERGVIAELAYTGPPEEADARLIAAAPAPLAALRGAERALSFILDGEDHRPARWVIPGSAVREATRAVARAALAKAEA